ncbi:MAG: prepilin-type N-terminal cleavage/methylation domain-containing protein [Puniceicoccaceae bacterium]|nr:MAG: prepilin-type N-terminal cleavage/methylation domain-containing protein [Puniceicoccaceae bacterium]
MMNGARTGRRWRDFRGFTLMEVLVAVALFTFAVTVFAAAYINVLTGLERVKADHILERELAWVRQQLLVEGSREEVERGGDIATAQLGQAVWRATVEETEVADLFRVELEIELADPGVGRSAVHRQRLHLLRPGWSDPAERDRLRAATRERLLEEQLRRP